MIREGTLTFSNNNASLDTIFLGIQGGQPNPIAAAHDRLRTAGFHSGDHVRAEGVAGRIGNVVVFFITRITRALVPAAAGGLAAEVRDLVTVTADGALIFKASTALAPAGQSVLRKRSTPNPDTRTAKGRASKHAGKTKRRRP